MEKKYKIGLLVGRFQPFHNGHLYLLRKALVDVEKLIIGIGSTNVQDLDNPLSFEQRKKMLEMVIEKEKIKDKIIKIISLPDIPDDNQWLIVSVNEAGQFNVVIGNNDWTNNIFKNAGFPVLEYPFFQRWILEGVKIRKFIKLDKGWEKKIPGYLISFIKDHQDQFRI